MKLNIQEIRKQPEGLHFEQTLDLSADLRERNQEILDVKDIVAVGKVQYEDRMFFLSWYNQGSKSLWRKYEIKYSRNP